MVTVWLSLTSREVGLNRKCWLPAVLLSRLKSFAASCELIDQTMPAPGPAGSGSLKVKPEAGLGPLLVTVTVNVAVPPSPVVGGPDTATCKSVGSIAVIAGENSEVSPT